MKVAVFCSSQPVPNRFLNLARELGTKLAENKFDIVWGGGKNSMMGEVSLSGIEAGGKAFGFIPDILVDKEQAADYATELVVTKDMSERKALMIDAADAFVIMPGGMGTLEELTQIWTSAYIGEHTKPIIILNEENFYSEFIDWLQKISQVGFLPEKTINYVTKVDSVENVIKTLIEK